MAQFANPESLEQRVLGLRQLPSREQLPTQPVPCVRKQLRIVDPVGREDGSPEHLPGLLQLSIFRQQRAQCDQPPDSAGRELQSGIVLPGGDLGAPHRIYRGVDLT